MVPVAGLPGPVDSVSEVAAALEPRRRAFLQDADGLALLPLQQVAKDLCEQLVVAVVILGGIERYDERVLAREADQHVPAPGHAGDRVGQRSGHLMEEARLDQQPALRFRLVAENLVHQVLTDAARIQRQFGHEIGGVLGALHPHGGQLHARRPSLGPRRQDAEIPGREGDPVGAEHLGDLGRVMARSAARSSCICPASRYRCSGSRGSLRAARISLSPGCDPRIRLSRPARTSGWLSTCASSMTTTSLASGSGARLNNAWTRSTPAARGVAASGPLSTLSPSRSADSSRRQNRRGSASAAVGVSHATRAPPRRTQFGEQYGLAGPRSGGQQGERPVRGVVELGEQARARHVPQREPRDTHTRITHCVRHAGSLSPRPRRARSAPRKQRDRYFKWAPPEMEVSAFVPYEKGPARQRGYRPARCGPRAVPGLSG